MRYYPVLLFSIQLFENVNGGNLNKHQQNYINPLIQVPQCFLLHFDTTNSSPFLGRQISCNGTKQC